MGRQSQKNISHAFLIHYSSTPFFQYSNWSQAPNFKKGEHKMRCLHIKPSRGFCLSLIMLCFFFLLLFSACGSDRSSSSSSDDTTSDSGSIAFSVVFQGAAGNIQARAAVLDCAGVGVTTVAANIYTQQNTLLNSGGPWNCNLGQGTITGVKAGTNRKVVIQGKDSAGDILYEGERTGVTVTAGITNNIGAVTVAAVTLVWDVGKWDKAAWQ